MAKGSMRPNKEKRKPKKDAKAAKAPVTTAGGFKTPAVEATKIKKP